MAMSVFRAMLPNADSPQPAQLRTFKAHQENPESRDL